MEFNTLNQNKTPVTNPDPDITIVQAQITDLSEKLEKIEETVKERRSESKNIIIGVVLAALFVFIVLAIEIIIFHTQYSNIGDKYQQKIDAIEAKIITTKNQEKE